MKKIKYILLSFFTIVLISCENEVLDDLRDIRGNNEDPVVLEDLNVGDLDFSNYVALGASFTAGYTDGGLFTASQENSFPNILSQQFANANGGTFTQPLMDDNTGGLLVGTTVANGYRFVVNLLADSPAPIPLNLYLPQIGQSVPNITTNAVNNLGSTFNNVGVPGAKSFHIPFNGYGALNPFYGRFASSPTSSMLEDALTQNPTFFTLSELGGNDVLVYATSGGTGTDQTGNLDPTTYAINDITDPTVFASAFNATVTALTANGAQGVVTNVPYITSLPHFTTIVYNQLDPNDEDTGPALVAQIPALNAQLYGPLDNIFTAFGEPDRVQLLSDSVPNPLLINDENATDRSAEITAALTPVLGAQTAAAFGAVFGRARHATPNDLVVLSASSEIGNPVTGAPAPINVNGISFPLADNWVLTPEEQAAIRTAVDAYNATIADIASANDNIALVDLNTILTQAATVGISFDDYTLSSGLITGGLVSLDGIHLTARGYALMANKFLEAIDAEFGTNFIASGTVAKAEDYNTTYAPVLQ